MSYSIEILNDKAIKLLQYLEELQLIRLEKKQPLENNAPKPQSFIGIISQDEADDLRRQLSEMRNEWERI
jgi:hypothetical protein